MRPPSGEKETSALVPKPAKDNKRKRASVFEDLELKTRPARKPRKNTILLTEESVRRLRDEEEEEEENDSSILEARVRKTIDFPKTAGSMVVDEAPLRTEGVSEKDSGKVPESLKIEDASHRRQKEDEMKDLRAELAKAHQDQTDLIEQLQQKIERIEQFCEEFDMIKVESLGWKEGMDRFAAEKETARAQLSSIESQLKGMKEKSPAQARKIEELEARLASKVAKAKSEGENANAEADAIVAFYRADAEAAQVQARETSETAQTRAYWIAELPRCQSRRETLEDIHPLGFDLTNEIAKAREHEAEVGALATSDDDRSKSGSENEEDLDVEEASPGGGQEP
ncbi:uncharacterized protein [Nicotiana tomentosiformis]|uniref:uncharacterized protein n=1 Tax=Nicotiana tomentosiformis TaxID=4098 RepID=UPI00388CC032